jgi:hypothetical protein
MSCALGLPSLYVSAFDAPKGGWQAKCCESLFPMKSSLAQSGSLWLTKHRTLAVVARGLPDMGARVANADSERARTASEPTRSFVSDRRR